MLKICRYGDPILEGWANRRRGGCLNIAMQRYVVAVGEFLIIFPSLFLSYLPFSIGRQQFIASDLDHMLPTYVMMQRRTMQCGATLSGSINYLKTAEWDLLTAPKQQTEEERLLRRNADSSGRTNYGKSTP